MSQKPFEIFDTKDGFQLKNFFLELKRRRLLILVLFISSFILGVFYAKSKPNLYESSVIFLPQATASPKIGGNLSSLAALAGVKINSSGQSGEISPAVYPRIFESISFRLLLAESSISTNQGQITTLEKYCNENLKKSSFFSSVIGKIKSLFTSSAKNNEFVQTNTLNVISLSETERFTLSKIDELTNIQINTDEGYIKLSSITEDPSISAQIASNAGEILQKKIIDIQVKRAADQLEYLTTRLAEQEEVFRKAQTKLADFKDRNQFASTQRTTSLLNRLQSDYDLAFGVYLDLAQQVEAQQLQVKKDAPIFTILEGAVIPKFKVGPNRMAIVIFFVFIGFLVAGTLVVGKQYLNYTLKN